MCSWEGDRHQFLWQISKPGSASFTRVLPLAQIDTINPALQFLCIWRDNKKQTPSIVWACAHIIYFPNRKPWPLSREFTRNVTYTKNPPRPIGASRPKLSFLARSTQQHMHITAKARREIKIVCCGAARTWCVHTAFVSFSIWPQISYAAAA